LPHQKHTHRKTFSTLSAVSLLKIGKPKLMQPKCPSHVPAGSKQVKHKTPGFVLPSKPESGPVMTVWALLAMSDEVTSTRPLWRASFWPYIASWMQSYSNFRSIFPRQRDAPLLPPFFSPLQVSLRTPKKIKTKGRMNDTLRLNSTTKQKKQEGHIKHKKENKKVQK